MARTMRTSREGLALIKRFEGFRAEAVSLGDGRWIVGYGHVRGARAGVRLTEAEATLVLREYDLPPVEALVSRLVLAPLSQGQFDALVSFAFNVGADAFARSDTLALINSGQPLKAAEAMGDWRVARIGGRAIIVDALVRRRAAERALFLDDSRGRPEAPSPIVRPRPDRQREENLWAWRAGSVSAPAQVQDAPAAREPARDCEAAATVGEAAPSSGPEAEAEPGRVQAAARSLGDRLTRILGEPVERPDAIADTSARPGPEKVREIQDAVSRLAASAISRPQTADPSAAAAPVEPLGEPLDEADDAPEGEVADTGRSVGFIDDLAPCDLPAPPAQGGTAPPAWISTALYAATALVGLGICAWGLTRMGAAAGRTPAGGAGWDAYAGPFALFLGVMLTLIMAYYTVRDVADRDDART